MRSRSRAPAGLPLSLRAVRVSLEVASAARGLLGVRSGSAPLPGGMRVTELTRPHQWQAKAQFRQIQSTRGARLGQRRVRSRLDKVPGRIAHLQHQEHTTLAQIGAIDAVSRSQGTNCGTGTKAAVPDPENPRACLRVLHQQILHPGARRPVQARMRMVSPLGVSQVSIPTF